MKIRQKAVGLAVMIGLLLAAGWPVSAQDSLPLQVRTMQFSAAPTEPPTVEEAEGTFVFKLSAVGEMTGDMEGTFTQHITQVHPDVLNASVLNRLLYITTFFTIETADGTIEGYYAGPFYFPEATLPDATVRQRGQVLSVTAAYADLFMADVFYDGIVDFEEVEGNMIGVSDSGTLTIAPR